MKTLLLIVVVLGSWIGMNAYNDQKLFSNPLAEKSSTEKLIDAAKNQIDEGGNYLKEKGSELVEKTEELAADAVEKGEEVAAEAKSAAIDTYQKTKQELTPDSN